MAIEEANAARVRDLLAHKQELRIPAYQRPYAWTPEIALQLVDDVKDARTKRNAFNVPYVLGAIILHKRRDVFGSFVFDVVDGQQRLLTLRMIAAIIKSKPFSIMRTTKHQLFWSGEN